MAKGCVMSKGLDLILQAIAKTPSHDLLKNRFISLVKELENATERAEWLVKLSEILLNHLPNEALSISKQAYLEDKLNPKTLEIIQKCLEILGENQKAQAILNKINSLSNEIKTTILPIDDSSLQPTMIIQSPPDEAKGVIGKDFNEEITQTRQNVSHTVESMPVAQQTNFEENPSQDTLIISATEPFEYKCSTNEIPFCLFPLNLEVATNKVSLPSKLNAKQAKNLSAFLQTLKSSDKSQERYSAIKNFVDNKPSQELSYLLIENEMIAGDNRLLELCLDGFIESGLYRSALHCLRKYIKEFDPYLWPKIAATRLEIICQNLGIFPPQTLQNLGSWLNMPHSPSFYSCLGLDAYL